MNKPLSILLDEAAAMGSSPAHSGFLRDCAVKARGLETRGELQEDVTAFHDKFGHRVGLLPFLPGDETWWQFRGRLLAEEVNELQEAMAQRDLAAIAQESVDVVVVVLGTLVGLGIPFMPFWRDVHRANMSKEPNPAGTQLKPVKPKGWNPPRPKRVLAEFIDSIFPPKF